MNFTKLLCLSLITILLGCGKNDHANNSYKNSEYIWFVDDYSDEGEWLKLEDESDNYLKNGSYEMYYSNGSIYEKGHFNEFGDYDTAWYYDTSSQITHYTVDENDYFHTCILREGKFSTFSTERELIITGINNNNEFINVEFHGPLQIPLKLLCIYFEAYETTIQNRNSIVPLMDQITKKNGIESSSLTASMDSITQMNKKHLALLKIQLTFTQNDAKTREMKNDIVNYLDISTKQLDDDYTKLFSLTAEGLTNDERTKAIEILDSMKDEIINATNQVMKSYKVVMDPFRYQGYIYNLIDPFVANCKASNN